MLFRSQLVQKGSCWKPEAWLYSYLSIIWNHSSQRQFSPHRNLCSISFIIWILTCSHLLSTNLLHYLTLLITDCLLFRPSRTDKCCCAWKVVWWKIMSWRNVRKCACTRQAASLILPQYSRIQGSLSRCLTLCIIWWTEKRF